MNPAFCAIACRIEEIVLIGKTARGNPVGIREGIAETGSVVIGIQSRKQKIDAKLEAVRAFVPIDRIHNVVHGGSIAGGIGNVLARSRMKTQGWLESPLMPKTLARQAVTDIVHNVRSPKAGVTEDKALRQADEVVIGGLPGRNGALL